MPSSTTSLHTIVVLFFVGCGEPRRGPELFPVTGSVTYDGEPVEGASVVFLPQDHKLAATARTDEEGRDEHRCTSWSASGEGLPGFWGAIHKLKAINVCVLEVKSQTNRLAGQR